MARTSSSKKKSKDEEDPSPEVTQRKRLKALAFSNNLLSEVPAKPRAPFTPSNTVVKHHGKGLLKKSQRKNRFLFSFPGLLAPIGGGKIGELKDLGIIPRFLSDRIFRCLVDWDTSREPRRSPT